MSKKNEVLQSDKKGWRAIHTEGWKHKPRTIQFSQKADVVPHATLVQSVQGGWVKQAYSRLLTNSWSYHRLQVGFGGVCRCMRGDLNIKLSCLDRTIHVRQFLVVKPSIQFHHRWAERNHSDHLYWLRPVGCLTPWYQAPSWEAQTSHFLRLWCDAVGNRTLASRTPSGRSNHYSMRGRRSLYRTFDAWTYSSFAGRYHPQGFPCMYNICTLSLRKRKLAYLAFTSISTQKTDVYRQIHGNIRGHAHVWRYL